MTYLFAQEFLKFLTSFSYHCCNRYNVKSYGPEPTFFLRCGDIKKKSRRKKCNITLVAVYDELIWSPTNNNYNHWSKTESDMSYYHI